MTLDTGMFTTDIVSFVDLNGFYLTTHTRDYAERQLKRGVVVKTSNPNVYQLAPAAVAQSVVTEQERREQKWRERVARRKASA